GFDDQLPMVLRFQVANLAHGALTGRVGEELAFVAYLEVGRLQRQDRAEPRGRQGAKGQSANEAHHKDNSCRKGFRNSGNAHGLPLVLSQCAAVRYGSGFYGTGGPIAKGVVFFGGEGAPVARWRSTTILALRHRGGVALGGDGQVTLGTVVMKNDAK